MIYCFQFNTGLIFRTQEQVEWMQGSLKNRSGELPNGKIYFYNIESEVQYFECHRNDLTLSWKEDK